MTDVHRLAHLGFEYLQALFTVCEVHLTILHPSDVLVLEHELTENFYAFLTAHAQPSEGWRALPTTTSLPNRAPLGSGVSLSVPCVALST